MNRVRCRHEDPPEEVAPRAVSPNKTGGEVSATIRVADGMEARLGVS
jgi:hypothetical protein